MAMTVHIFKRIDDTYGLTPSPLGSNLPSRNTGWEWQGSLELEAEKLNRLGIDSEQAILDIQVLGYHLDTMAEMLRRRRDR